MCLKFQPKYFALLQLFKIKISAVELDHPVLQTDFDYKSILILISRSKAEKSREILNFSGYAPISIMSQYEWICT